MEAVLPAAAPEALRAVAAAIASDPCFFNRSHLSNSITVYCFLPEDVLFILKRVNYSKKRTTGRFPVSGSCLFACNHDWLIKAGFFREFPHDPAAAGSQQELRQLLSAYSPVGALELADRERFFIGDYILDQIIPVLFPVPGLKRDPTALPCIVDIRRRVRRPIL